MADGGKGSARRPGAMPVGAWERVFGNLVRENVTPPDAPPEGQPTDDGPGQPAASDTQGGEP